LAERRRIEGIVFDIRNELADECAKRATAIQAGTASKPERDDDDGE
jgi:hypothetical protein